MTLLRQKSLLAEKHSDVASTSAVEAFAGSSLGAAEFARGDDEDVEPRINRAGHSALSAGHAHVARYGRSIIGAVNDEIVALGFAGNGLADRRI